VRAGSSTQPRLQPGRPWCAGTPSAAQRHAPGRACPAAGRACSAAAARASGVSERGRTCQYAGAASFVRQLRHTVLRRHRSRVPARSAAARRAAAPTSKAQPRAAQRLRLPAGMSGAGTRGCSFRDTDAFAAATADTAGRPNAASMQAAVLALARCRARTRPRPREHALLSADTAETAGTAGHAWRAPAGATGLARGGGRPDEAIGITLTLAGGRRACAQVQAGVPEDLVQQLLGQQVQRRGRPPRRRACRPPARSAQWGAQTGLGRTASGRLGARPAARSLQAAGSQGAGLCRAAVCSAAAPQAAGRHAAPSERMAA